MSYLCNGDIITINSNGKAVFVNTNKDGFGANPSILFTNSNPTLFALIKVNLDQSSPYCNGGNICGTFKAGNYGDPIYYGDLVYFWTYRNYDAPYPGYPYESGRSGDPLSFTGPDYIVPVEDASYLTDGGKSNLFNASTTGFCNDKDIDGGTSSRALFAIVRTDSKGYVPGAQVNGCNFTRTSPGTQVPYSDNFLLQVVYESCCQNGNLSSDKPMSTWLYYNNTSVTINNLSYVGYVGAQDTSSSLPPTSTESLYIFNFVNNNDTSKSLTYSNSPGNWNILFWIVFILLIIAIVIIVFIFLNGKNGSIK